MTKPTKEAHVQAQRKYRKNKKQRDARFAVLFNAGSEQIPSKSDSLELTDEVLDRIRSLRDGIANLNKKQKHTGAVAIVTFPLAASEEIKAIAKRLDIPVTPTGICFMADCDEDLDYIFWQVYNFVGEVRKYASSTLDSE